MLLSVIFSTRQSITRFIPHARSYASKASPPRPFSITYTISSEPEPITERYISAEAFSQSFHGWRFLDRDKDMMHSNITLPLHAKAGVTYHAQHPLERARVKGITHNQVTDKVLEEKAIQCVERYISQWPDFHRRIDSGTRAGGWRYLTDAKTGRDTAEWEGIWEDSCGNFIFLEAKHLVDPVSF